MMNVVFLGHPELEFEDDEPLRGEFLENEDEIVPYLQSDTRYVFVVLNEPRLEPFMPRIYANLSEGVRQHDLLLPWSIDPELDQYLHTMFDRVVTGTFPKRFLPYEQIVEIMCCTKNPGEYIIGSSRWSYDGHVLMYQGNLNPMLVPEDWFTPNPLASPDFSKIRAIDWGQGLQLGSEYEVASRHLVREFGQSS